MTKKKRIERKVGETEKWRERVNLTTKRSFLISKLINRSVCFTNFSQPNPKKKKNS